MSRLHARVASTLAVLLLSLAVAGCGDDRIVGPADELTGVWVRYEATPPLGALVARLDSLVIAPDGTVRWSQQAIHCCGGPPFQVEYPLEVERRGFAVFLVFRPQPCATCQSASIGPALVASPRRNQLGPFEMRVIRRGRDSLELHPVEGEPVEHYIRVQGRTGGD